MRDAAQVPVCCFQLFAALAQLIDEMLNSLVCIPGLDRRSAALRMVPIAFQITLALAFAESNGIFWRSNCSVSSI
jgi:hypothetical protein